MRVLHTIFFLFSPPSEGHQHEHRQRVANCSLSLSLTTLQVIAMRKEETKGEKIFLHIQESVNHEGIEFPLDQFVRTSSGRNV